MRKHPFPTLLLLFWFVNVGAVIYTPALPAIAKYFQVSAGVAQLSVTYYLIGYTLGLLPFGPLANAIGRRKTVYVGCLISIVGSLLCIFGTTFWLFNLGRIIGAIGMSSGTVIIFTMLGDLYNNQEARRIISFIRFFLLSAIATFIGGFLTQYINWQSCFYFLIGYAIILAYLTSRLPKTGPEPGFHHVHLKKVVLGYWQQIKCSPVMLGGLFMGCASIPVYTFAAEAPFIAIKELGISPTLFGTYNIFALSGGAVGALVSAYLSHRISTLQALALGTLFIGGASLTQFLLFLFDLVNLWTLFLPFAFIYFGISVTYSAASSNVTAHATNKSKASAMMAFISIALSTLGVLFISLVDPTNNLMMPLLFTGISLAMILLFFLMRRADA